MFPKMFSCLGTQQTFVVETVFGGLSNTHHLLKMVIQVVQLVRVVQVVNW